MEEIQFEDCRRAVQRFTTAESATELNSDLTQSHTYAPGQAPTYFGIPGSVLRAMPWWTAEHLPEVFGTLKDFYPEIRGECHQLYMKRREACERVHKNCINGTWEIIYFMESGTWVEEACRECPFTAAMLKSLPICTSSLGHIYISSISSGTHITPHCGCTNVKLRAQLPIFGSGKQCTIRVGLSQSDPDIESNTKLIEDGEPIVFDDSFVHEVMNANDADSSERVVLVIDIWHPDLYTRSIDYLSEQFHGDKSNIFSNATSKHNVSTNAKDFDYLFKFLMIGDSSAGKTCFLLRFADDSFNSSFISTIGVDFKIRTVEIEGLIYKLQIWDTAGPERFRTITSSYYRGAHGIFVMFDLDDRESFNNVNHWISEVKKHGSKHVRVILVGNKKDLISESTPRVISYEEAAVLAASYEIPYYECSSKTGEHVTDIVCNMILKVKTEVIDTNIIPISAPRAGSSTTTPVERSADNNRLCSLV